MDDDDKDKAKDAARQKLVTEQAMEQGIASLTDMYPRLWFGLFRGLKEQGFTPQEALELLKVYIAKN